MSVQRETKSVPGFPAPAPFLSPAVISNGFVFCSGQIPATPDGKLVEGTMTDRLNQCVDNLEAVLKAHGSSIDNIVKCNIFVTSYKDFDEMNKAYVARMPKPAPARSCIGVAVLPRGVDIEIECHAALPKARL